MIKRSNDRVWILGNTGEYYQLGAGISNLREVCKTAILETPHIDSPVCSQEILYHTGHLEFEGFRIDGDYALNLLISRHMKRGKDAKITLIIGNSHDSGGTNAFIARKITGYVCLENPGTGEGVFGSRIKGKIIYASEPIRGVYHEDRQLFSEL